MNPNLYPYQRTGARFLADRNVALLADAMGVGKTPQAIAACDLVGARSVLVLCPAIARENWRREFIRWATTDRTIATVRSSLDLTKPEIIVADVLIVSYSLLVSRVAHRMLLARHHDVLICDEMHQLKNPVAHRSKVVYGHHLNRKGGLTERAERVFLLSGTPMPNHAGELFTHLRALCPEKLLRAGIPLLYNDFLDHFCHTVEGDWGPRVLGNKNQQELLAMVKPITLRRRLEDVQTELPPLRWGHVVVSVDDLPTRDRPSNQERIAVEAARAKVGNDTEALAILEAQQMHLATLRRWTGAAKASAVAEMIKDELEGGLERVVVFALHRDVISCIQNMLGKNAVAIHGGIPVSQRQAAIDAFQSAGGPRVLICQMSIASTAINLTAASDVIFAESSWVPADMAQAAARCHRIGQTRPVLARVVSLAGSIDEIVGAAITRKSAEVKQFEVAVTEAAA